MAAAREDRQGSPGAHAASKRLPYSVLAEIRRARRHPRPWQFDYLHLRSLLRDLETVLGRVNGPLEVLDVYCGTRPYEDLLPTGSHSIGLDVDHQYGAADIVTDEFLPFPDASFDLVMCTEAFHYVQHPSQGVAEFARVLRPGGRVLLTVPLVWEYDRTIMEHRYTGPELAALFDGWRDVEVIENGGYAVSWTTLTGRIINAFERRVANRLGTPLRPLFSLVYLMVNCAGLALEVFERGFMGGVVTLPMNLLLTARAPA
jgi:SAM-dependent methyltransferase